jgi:hypothetical protein
MCDNLLHVSAIDVAAVRVAIQRIKDEKIEVTEPIQNVK